MGDRVRSFLSELAELRSSWVTTANGNHREILSKIQHAVEKAEKMKKSLQGELETLNNLKQMYADNVDSAEGNYFHAIANLELFDLEFQEYEQGLENMVKYKQTFEKGPDLLQLAKIKIDAGDDVLESFFRDFCELFLRVDQKTFIWDVFVKENLVKKTYPENVLKKLMDLDVKRYSETDYDLIFSLVKRRNGVMNALTEKKIITAVSNNMDNLFYFVDSTKKYYEMMRETEKHLLEYRRLERIILDRKRDLDAAIIRFANFDDSIYAVTDGIKLCEEVIIKLKSVESKVSTSINVRAKAIAKAN